MTKWSQKWSLEELEFLRDNYKKLGPTEIAKRLNRMYYHVIGRYWDLKARNFRIRKEFYLRKPFKFPNLTPFELGYVAGFIDGEGSLGLPISRKNGKPRYCNVIVSVGNIDPKPMEFIHKALKIPWPLTRYSCNHKVMSSLSFSGKQQVQELLKHLAPHLIVKKEQAEIILQLFRQHEFQKWSLNDWKLVLKHAEANKVDTRPSRLKRIKELRSFIKKLESNANHTSC